MEFLQFFLSSSDEGHQLFARSWEGGRGCLDVKRMRRYFGFPVN